METEFRVRETIQSVYWVIDADGNRRLFHDHLAAQLMEDRWKREREEKAKNDTVK
jgi:hypothetical protein